MKPWQALLLTLGSAALWCMLGLDDVPPHQKIRARDLATASVDGYRLGQRFTGQGWRPINDFDGFLQVWEKQGSKIATMESRITHVLGTCYRGSGRVLSRGMSGRRALLMLELMGPNHATNYRSIATQLEGPGPLCPTRPLPDIHRDEDQLGVPCQQTVHVFTENGWVRWVELRANVGWPKKFYEQFRPGGIPHKRSVRYHHGRSSRPYSASYPSSTPRGSEWPPAHDRLKEAGLNLRS